MKSPGIDGFTDEIQQIFEKYIILILHKHVQKTEEEEILPNSFNEASINYTKARQRHCKERKLQTNT